MIDLGDSSEGMLRVLESKIQAGGFKNMYPRRIDWSIDEANDEQYDIVYTLMTLHYILDYRAVLEKFLRSLKSGGCLCLADLEKEDGTFHGPGFVTVRKADGALKDAANLTKDHEWP